MPYIVSEIIELLGFLLRVLGFLVIGFGIGRFILDAYKQAVWQVQIALVLGFFGLLAAITNFTSAGSAGAFVLSAGVSFFMPAKPGQYVEGEEEAQKKKK